MNSHKNKKITYVSLALLLFIIIGVILYIKMMRPIKSVEENGAKSEAKGESNKLDISILQSDFFKELTRYGEYPINPRYPGRKNPFESY